MRHMGRLISGERTWVLLGVRWVTGGGSQDARLWAELKFSAYLRRSVQRGARGAGVGLRGMLDFDTLLCMPPWNMAFPAPKITSVSGSFWGQVTRSYGLRQG